MLALSLVPVLALTASGREPDGRLGSAVSDVSLFLFCRLLGFAHRDGAARRKPRLLP